MPTKHTVSHRKNQHGGFFISVPAAIAAALAAAKVAAKLAAAGAATEAGAQLVKHTVGSGRRPSGGKKVARKKKTRGGNVLFSNPAVLAQLGLLPTIKT